MILHSHAMDIQSRAEDLASAILCASTPPQISAACAAVESFLRRHPHDQSRIFFSVAFPALICRLFGFDDSSSASSGASSSSSARPAPPQPTGWVDQLDLEAAASVTELMSPGGVLFSAIASADRQALVRYVFPLERLPEWMRWALLHVDRCGGEDALPDLCPLFKSRVRKDPVQKTLQLQLDAFEYFIFWFAYFPVCRGASEVAATGTGVGFHATRKASRRFRIENWTSAWPAALASGKRRPGQKMECSLYLRLLYAYLRAFVPKCSTGSTPQPYRSSLLHYTLAEDNSAALQAEFIVHTLFHFWMVDNDFSPLSLKVCNSFGISFPFRKVLGEAPPTPGLGEPLKLLVRYLTYNSVTSTAAKSGQAEFSGGGTPGWTTPRSTSFGVGKFKTELLSCEQLVGPWNSLLQRPLYRFIARTFLFCPIGASMKNATDVFSLWVTYLEPWKASTDDFLELESCEQQKQDAVQKEGVQNPEQGKQHTHYTSVWQNYVASNYLFYSSLVMHFLSFAHKFLHTNVETIIPMVLKVVHILASSDELVDFLKSIDAAYHSKSSSASAFKDSSIKYVPAIREQLQDWDDGLCGSLADGSSHEYHNCDLNLFGEGDDGAQCLLQLLILRAATEIRAISAGNEQQLRQDLSSLRSGVIALFGGPVERFLSPIATRSPSDHSREQQREEVFTPKRRAEVKYQGDWMRRPASDTEIAWLVRHLVRLSNWLNSRLGLDRTGCDEAIGPIYIELPASNDLSKVHGAKDAVWMVLVTLVSWVLMSVQWLLRFMRRRGLRINLRILASKKVATALAVYVVVSMLRRAVASLLWL